VLAVVMLCAGGTVPAGLSPPRGEIGPPDWTPGALLSEASSLLAGGEERRHEDLREPWC